MDAQAIRPIMNAQQCAELLQCSEDTVEEMSRLGELPGVKYGRGWIYVTADLLAYLAEKGRREAEERRLGKQDATKGAKAPLASLVKPRRKTPPALPVLPTAVVQGLRPGNWHSAGPSTSQASSP